MASTTYTQRFVDGTEQVVRRTKKQGSPPKPDSLKRRNQFTIYLTDAEAQQCAEIEKNIPFRHSEYWSMVLFLGLQQLFNANDCSIQ